MSIWGDVLGTLAGGVAQGLATRIGGQQRAGSTFVQVGPGGGPPGTVLGGLNMGTVQTLRATPAGEIALGFNPFGNGNGNGVDQPGMFGEGGLLGSGCDFRFFGTPSGNARVRRRIQAQNPDTGKIHTFRHEGDPVLTQADIRSMKKVRAVARSLGPLVRPRTKTVTRVQTRRIKA